MRIELIKRPQQSTRTRRSDRPYPGRRSKVCGVWWVVAIAWGAALIVAAVVLGSCLYELSWKSARLRKDVALLTEAEAELAGLQAQIRAAQERLAIVRLER